MSDGQRTIPTTRTTTCTGPERCAKCGTLYVTSETFCYVHGIGPFCERCIRRGLTVTVDVTMEEASP